MMHSCDLGCVPYGNIMNSLEPIRIRFYVGRFKKLIEGKQTKRFKYHHKNLKEDE